MESPAMEGPSPLAQMGLIGNAHFGSEPLFSSLLNNDSDANGFFDVELSGFLYSEQAYISKTNILVTNLFSSDGSAVEVKDVAPRFEMYDRMHCPFQFIRVITPLQGDPQVRIRMRPTFGYNSAEPVQTRGSHHIRFCGPRGSTWRVTTNAGLSYVVDEEPFLVQSPVSFVIGPDEPLQSSVEELVADFERRCVDYWGQWVQQIRLPPNCKYQKHIIRSALTLKMLQAEETGGLVASVSLGIPLGPNEPPSREERVYRLLDECLGMGVLREAGLFASVKRQVHFLKNVLYRSSLPQMEFGVHLKETLPALPAPFLAGYGGVGPVTANGLFREYAGVDHPALLALLTHCLAPVFSDARLAEFASPDLLAKLEHAALMCMRWVVGAVTAMIRADEAQDQSELKFSDALKVFARLVLYKSKVGDAQEADEEDAPAGPGGPAHGPGCLGVPETCTCGLYVRAPDGTLVKKKKKNRGRKRARGPRKLAAGEVFDWLPEKALLTGLLPLAGPDAWFEEMPSSMLAKAGWVVQNPAEAPHLYKHTVHLPPKSNHSATPISFAPSANVANVPGSAAVSNIAAVAPQKISGHSRGLSTMSTGSTSRYGDGSANGVSVSRDFKAYPRGQAPALAGPPSFVHEYALVDLLRLNGPTSIKKFVFKRKAVDDAFFNLPPHLLASSHSASSTTPAQQPLQQPANGRAPPTSANLEVEPLTPLFPQHGPSDGFGTPCRQMSMEPEGEMGAFPNLSLDLMDDDFVHINSPDGLNGGQNSAHIVQSNNNPASGSTNTNDQQQQSAKEESGPATGATWKGRKVYPAPALSPLVDAADPVAVLEQLMQQVEDRTAARAARRLKQRVALLALAKEARLPPQEAEALVEQTIRSLALGDDGPLLLPIEAPPVSTLTSILCLVACRDLAEACAALAEGQSRGASVAARHEKSAHVTTTATASGFDPEPVTAPSAPGATISFGKLNVSLPPKLATPNNDAANASQKSKQTTASSSGSKGGAASANASHPPSVSLLASPAELTAMSKKWSYAADLVHACVNKYGVHPSKGGLVSFWRGDCTGPSVLRALELGFGNSSLMQATVSQFESDCRYSASVAFSKIKDDAARFKHELLQASAEDLSASLGIDATVLGLLARLPAPTLPAGVKAPKGAAQLQTYFSMSACLGADGSPASLESLSLTLPSKDSVVGRLPHIGLFDQTGGTSPAAAGDPSQNDDPEVVHPTPTSNGGGGVFTSNSLLWYSEALRQAGRAAESKSVFESVLGCLGPTGIVTQSVDIEGGGHLWGNAPSTPAVLNVIRCGLRTNTHNQQQQQQQGEDGASVKAHSSEEGA